MKYFINEPYSFDELKNEFRILCKKLHPDVGGNAEIFKEMLNEYETVRQSINKTYTTYDRTKEYETKTKNKTKYDSTKNKTGSNSTANIRYDMLYNSLIYGNRCEISKNTLTECLMIFKKLSDIPFCDARVIYYKYDETVLMTLQFEKTMVVEELEITKFTGYDELSYKIFYTDPMMYMSTAKIDIIIEKILGEIHKTNYSQHTY